MLVEIRSVTIEEAPSILSIYSHYVLETAVTFEYDVPTILEMEKRIMEREGKYPFLGAFLDGEMVGYAYLSPFKDRSAYDWSAETSIYVRRDMKGMGIGSMLLEALENEARKMKLLTLEACIAMPQDEDDPYLGMESVIFHSRKGYREVGRFLFSGFKFSSWYHMVWMEKEIGPHDCAPESVVWYGFVEDRL